MDILRIIPGAQFHHVFALADASGAPLISVDNADLLIERDGTRLFAAALAGAGASWALTMSAVQTRELPADKSLRYEITAALSGGGVETFRGAVETSREAPPYDPSGHMRGMSAETGRELYGIDHLRQSIRDILTTRIGTRVMRRDYGSEVPNMIDRPVNDAFAVDIYVACAEALDRWEPRFKLKRASMEPVGDGKVNFSFEGNYLPNGKPIKLEGIVVR